MGADWAMGGIAAFAAHISSGRSCAPSHPASSALAGPEEPGEALALLGSDGGERQHLLRHPLASAVRTRYAAFFHVRKMEVQRKFLVAILAEKYVLRHRHSPAKIIAPFRIPRDVNLPPVFRPEAWAGLSAEETVDLLAEGV